MSWYGAAGHDSGRDIVCQRSEFLGPRVFVLDCVVQCKRYSGYVSRDRLREDMLKASQHSPSYFILATTGIITAATKDSLTGLAKSTGIRLVLWERGDLEVLLERHQDLRQKFLHVGLDNERLLSQVLSECSMRQPAPHLHFDADLLSVITSAAAVSIHNSERLSTSHLVRAVCQLHPEVIEHYEMDPRVVDSMLHTAGVVQADPGDQLRFGLHLSPAVRRAVEHSVDSAQRSGHGRVTLRAMTEALLTNPQSGTVELLSAAHPMLPLFENSHPLSHTRFAQFRMSRTQMAIDREALHSEMKSIADAHAQAQSVTESSPVAGAPAHMEIHKEAAPPEQPAAEDPIPPVHRRHQP